MHYFTFNVANKTYAWSAGKRYLLKNQPAVQNQPAKLVFEKAYASREDFLTELGKESKTGMQAWTQAYLQQRLRLHLDKRRELIIHSAGSRYKVCLSELPNATTNLHDLQRQLLATKPSAEYAYLNMFADGQMTRQGIFAYSDKLLVVDAKKQIITGKRWFQKSEKTRGAQV